ncbi:hypothetical protein M0812_04044 [Anaeramoeba flamelloides]|uniref:Uncharacterized protein n=1 Tax=Anaeramoeba flamelloides TaxID=1746091 RepID=A0AAV8AH96_9EUKA|nr:hypothetical protein M0812_04044 [Anaeramoeba flamelloides]
MFSNLPQQDKKSKRIMINKKRTKKNTQQKKKATNFQVMPYEQIIANKKKKQQQLMKNKKLIQKKKSNLSTKTRLKPKPKAVPKPKQNQLQKRIVLKGGENKKTRTNIFQNKSSRLKPPPFSRKSSTTPPTSSKTISIIKSTQPLSATHSPIPTTTTTTTKPKTIQIIKKTKPLFGFHDQKKLLKEDPISQNPKLNTRKRNFQQTQLINSKKPKAKEIKKLTSKKQQSQEEATHQISLGEIISFSKNQKIKLSTDEEIKEFLNILFNVPQGTENNGTSMNIENTFKNDKEEVTLNNYNPIFSSTELQSFDQQFDHIEKRIQKIIKEYQLDIHLVTDNTMPSIEELDNYEKKLQQILN